jgi:hypothetical protein
MDLINELSRNLRAGLLLENSILKEIFEREFNEAIVPRMNIKSYNEGIAYDLDRNKRQPALGAMVIIAAVLGDVERSKKLLDYEYRVWIDHYDGQKAAGVSRDDLGPWPSEKKAVEMLYNEAVKYLEDNTTDIEFRSKVESALTHCKNRLFQVAKE